MINKNSDTERADGFITSAIISAGGSILCAAVFISLLASPLTSESTPARDSLGWFVTLGILVVVSLSLAYISGNRMRASDTYKRLSLSKLEELRR